MAFKNIHPQASVPESPDKLFLDLPRRKFPDVMPNQREMMKSYSIEGLEKKDVAMQLPTGSGKTLVGPLIAEWIKRKNRERAVYLCPTRQLVNQVVEQADEKYGLTVNGFTGSSQNYSKTAKAEYCNADKIAITTYSSLFNTNPFFNDADILIIDDAHVAENYVASLWTLRIERKKEDHKSLYSALCGILKPLLKPTDFVRLKGDSEGSSDWGWVDKIPTPEFFKIKDALTELFDLYLNNTDLWFPWSMLRDNLHACHLYISSKEILLRPLIPLTFPHFMDKLKVESYCFSGADRRGA